MDLASLRLRIPLHRVPAPAEQQIELHRLIDELTPFDGAMPTGSFNIGVAGAIADAPPVPPGMRSIRLRGR
jgi:hypothetical protein